MVSFRAVVLVLGTLFSLESVERTPEISWLLSSSCIVAAALLLGSWCKLHAIWLSGSSDPSSAVQAFVKQRKIVETMWALAYPVIAYLTSWVHWANWLETMGVWRAPVLLILFAPHILFILLVDISTAQFESAEASDGESPGWGEIWKTRIRLGELATFGFCLVPMLAVCFALDLHAFFLGSEKSGTPESVVVATGLCIFGTALLMTLYPVWIQYWMGAERLNSRSDDLSSAQARLAIRIHQLRRFNGVGRLQTILVPSNGRWRGAAVVGWLPWSRRLMLGDGLLQQLHHNEIDMVVLHEMAHITRKHFWWRLLPIVWSTGIGMAYALVGQDMTAQICPTWLGSTLSFVVSAAVLVIGIGTVSRSCELDADREACRLAAETCGWTRGCPSLAASRLVSALSTLLGSQSDASKRTWLHPGLRERQVSLAHALARWPRETLTPRVGFSSLNDPLVTAV